MRQVRGKFRFLFNINPGWNCISISRLNSGSSEEMVEGE